jgi:nucleoid-associated protein YgaU
MDYDYEQEDYGPRVLWGRLVLLLIGLVLVFFVGRCTAGGADARDLAQAESRVAELNSENQFLRAQLDAAQASQTPPTEGGRPTEGGQPPTEQPTGARDPIDQGQQKYVVQPGDTLTGIAEQFYGDQGKWELIAEANNLGSDTALTVGQELVIPEES